MHVILTFLIDLGVWLVNGAFWIGTFALHELPVVLVLAIALIFARWQIKAHALPFSGIDPEEVLG